ncbi:MAG: hypothetical protein QM820_57855 [Minicystis sp.]
MRTAVWLAFSSSFLAGAAGVQAAGCVNVADDCKLTASCTDYAADGSGGNGGKASLDPKCLIPPMQAKGGIDTSCGIFAAPGAPGGTGSASAPFSSLQAAIFAAAKTGKPVYACAKAFTEPIEVPSGVAIYGGLDCDNGWAWTASKRTLVKPPAWATPPGASEIGARLQAGEDKTVLSDVDVTAPDAVFAGTSSIALLVEDTEAEITRATFTAGDGKDGKPGKQFDDDPQLDGLPGSLGYGICVGGATNPAPEAVVKTCAFQASTGGRGGDGGLPAGATLDGGNGTDGQPQYTSLPNAGLGGLGQSASSCQPGGQGADGDKGTSGEGAVGLGAISSSGYKGVDGADGTDGKPGQGGGGGGAAKGKTQIQCTGAPTIDRAGATGGGGGTGGCGGARGSGGKAGGSSIAVVSLAKKTVSLTEVGLNVGSGGKGGNGGTGQTGGTGGLGASGGPGANGTSNGCTGGNGGNGGLGGPGGGGQGGHAIGIAYKNIAPKGTPSVTYKTTTPSPGLGGDAGANSTATNGKGADGTSGAVVQLAGP